MNINKQNRNKNCQKYISMKYIFGTILLLIFVINSCKKNNQIDDILENHRIDDILENNVIPLKYVDLIPDTNWIDIDNDSQKDIILYDTIIQYGIPGDTLYLNTTYLKSTNESISISWGRDCYPYAEYLLEKDSIVDNSLEWEYSFLVWGSGPWMNYGHDPNYIGIRYISTNDTLYGWIYKPSYNFTEYAIDTSANINGSIYAGHKNK